LGNGNEKTEWGKHGSATSMHRQKARGKEEKQKPNGKGDREIKAGAKGGGVGRLKGLGG